MKNSLQDFLNLKDNFSEINSDNVIIEVILDSSNLTTIQDFYNSNYIEELRFANTIISIDDLQNQIGKKISIEFVSSELKKIRFYLTFQDFIFDNRDELPKNDYYIHEFSYSSITPKIEIITKYEAITNLISKLSSISKFIFEEHVKSICLIHDNSFIEIQIDTEVYEDHLNLMGSEKINQYITDLESYKEKKSIFVKELIDFLQNFDKKNRFQELIKNFSEFYEKCNTSFEFYLSNFSFNKIKLELDNSVLEYSKNIRSIINDSQSKLIAIPAAFALAASQIDYNNPLIIKNIIIVVSAFLFSYIISVFIDNQKNAVEIITDNLINYKNNYKKSKSTDFEDEKELKNLSTLIEKAFAKTETEIRNQNKRLKIIQYCNWGISIVLSLTLLIIYLSKIEWNCGYS